MTHSGQCSVMFTLHAVFLFCVLVHATFEWTNLVCESLDEDFMKFDYCFIKAVNRSYKYISLRAKLFQLPITKASLTLTLLKRANGYKPFLYNFTFDGCKFLKNRKKGNHQLIEYFYQMLFQDYSNLNHTCPYNHDVILEKLPTPHLNNFFTKVLPMPLGDYCIESIWSPYNKPCSRVRAYGRVF